MYTQGGHGFVWRPAANGNPGYWGTMRPYINGMDEDLGNQDQIQPYADYALHAGATVVSMRPVGHQVAEDVVDNSDVYSASTGGFQVISGNWQGNTVTTPYWSNNNGNDTNHWMFAPTSTTETAVARFTANIPVAGFYPVYAWTNPGTNNSSNDRVSDQLYRINYAGGSQEIKVAQNMTGNGWIYLGDYYFAAGVNPLSGSVEVSNKSATTGKYVVADGIRFGNGMGDWTQYGTHPASGQPREDEPALYWCYDSRGWNGPNNRVSDDVVDLGNNNYADENKNFYACDAYAAYMNNSNVGSMYDRLWISFHSNAGGGRGTVGLITGIPTQNQDWLAQDTGSTVQTEMSALDSTIEYPWAVNSKVTFSGGYSEIGNNIIGGEFDATIIEVAYHDDAQDATLLKDPKVRWDVGRAAYHSAIKYFKNFASGFNNTTYLPEAPTNVRATTDTSGHVNLAWSAGLSSSGMNGPYGNAATGYQIWTSTNGYGFTLAATVGNVSTYQLSGLPMNQMTYFQVTALNAGGDSLPSSVIAAKPQNGARARILIVNNFNRLDAAGDQQESISGISGLTPSGLVARARIQYNNSSDYMVQAGEALESYNSSLGVESCSDSSIANGQISLGNYDQVIWMSGEQSSGDGTFTSTTQPLVAAYVNNGGHLFVSGSEIGWDLVAQGHGASFYQNSLHSNYVQDDAKTYKTTAGSGPFSSVPVLNFDNGTHGTYDVDFPDVISAGSGGAVGLSYSGGTGGGAMVYWQPSVGTSRVVNLAFPLESIYTPSQRNALMGAVMNYFTAARFAYLDGRTLRVNFTTPGSTIASSANATALSATQGSNALSFNLTDFDTIVVNGTPGNDNFNFGVGITKPITFTGQGGNDTINVNGGTITFAPAMPDPAGSLAINVASGAAAVLSSSMHLRSLSLGGSATLSPGGSKLLVANALTASTGSLDLSDNDLIIPAGALGTWNGSTYTGITGMIKSGAIKSSLAQNRSTTLGIATAGNIFGISGSQTGLFDGQTVNPTDVLVKFTYAGDANLDGKVNIDDYGRIDANVGQSGTVFGWYNGDFNFDGKINIDDYGLIDSVIGSQGPVL
jgi:hypothetical protein